MRETRLPLHVELKAWRRGDVDDVRTGLLGYLQLQVGHRLLLDGITLRRTIVGDTCLSFPCRIDGIGRRHSLIRPVDNDARLGIEGAVASSLRAMGEWHWGPT